MSVVKNKHAPAWNLALAGIKKKRTDSNRDKFRARLLLTSDKGLESIVLIWPDVAPPFAPPLTAVPRNGQTKDLWEILWNGCDWQRIAIDVVTASGMQFSAAVAFLKLAAKSFLIFPDGSISEHASEWMVTHE